MLHKNTGVLLCKYACKKYRGSPKFSGVSLPWDFLAGDFSGVCKQGLALGFVSRG